MRAPSMRASYVAVEHQHHFVQVDDRLVKPVAHILESSNFLGLVLVLLVLFLMFKHILVDLCTWQRREYERTEVWSGGLAVRVVPQHAPISCS